MDKIDWYSVQRKLNKVSDQLDSMTGHTDRAIEAIDRAIMHTDNCLDRLDDIKDFLSNSLDKSVKELTEELTKELARELIKYNLHKAINDLEADNNCKIQAIEFIDQLQAKVGNKLESKLPKCRMVDDGICLDWPVDDWKIIITDTPLDPKTVSIAVEQTVDRLFSANSADPRSLGASA